MEWEHYHAVKDTNGHSVADKIEDAFWLRYKYEDAYSEKAKQHVRRCCKALLTSIFYYARIQAIIDHFLKTEHIGMNDKLAGQYYLDRAQYLVQRQGWLGKEAWVVIVDEWCSEEWIAKSKKYCANRLSSKFKPHNGGSNSMTTISQKMSEQTGEEVNQIQAWVHTHKGLDKSKPLILNTPEATKCLALYTKKAKELNGQDYDILKNDVSSKALYDCSNGKPHGTWSLFNGIVNDIEVIAEVRATGTSSATLKHRRAEEIEDVRRKEFEKTQRAEAYANNLLSWGVGMYAYCNGIHKFLQTLATNQGLPIGEIPPPPVPPPSRSLSPLGSPQQSAIQILESIEKPPALCAQQETNSSSIHEHGVASSVPAASNAVEHEGMFGGFFSQAGTDSLSLSLLSNQLVP